MPAPAPAAAVKARVGQPPPAAAAKRRRPPPAARRGRGRHALEIFRRYYGTFRSWPKSSRPTATSCATPAPAWAPRCASRDARPHCHGRPEVRAFSAAAGTADAQRLRYVHSAACRQRPAMAQETPIYASKIDLKQELAIVRKEGDRLRTALEARTAGARRRTPRQLQTTRANWPRCASATPVRDDRPGRRARRRHSNRAAPHPAVPLTATEDHLAAASRLYPVAG